MAQTDVNIKMDAEPKIEFEEFCSDVGMSMTNVLEGNNLSKSFNSVSELMKDLNAEN